jgi:hypothetical protein
LIKSFFEWIVAERRNRLFTGTADGERDLIESPSKVQRRQSARKELLLRFDQGQDLFESKLEALFPELTRLARPRSLSKYCDLVAANDSTSSAFYAVLVESPATRI